MTTAPTTAALAIGDGPGDTAAPTTAALATGDGPGLATAPTTAVLATGAADDADVRATWSERHVRLLLLRAFGLVGLDGGDEGLDRDPAVGDELPAGSAHGRGERGGPQVLVDEDRGDAARVHGRGEVVDILFGEGLRELRLEPREFAELVEVGQLLASTVPSSSFWRIRMSMIRMIPASWSRRSSSAPSPVKFCGPAGNSTIR